MKILVVDDDTLIARAVERGLVAEGHQVDVSEDGEDALWRATDSAYDVIVLDLMLPSLDGHEVCRRLRAQGVWTPVLMLTAKNSTADETASLDLGADDFLAKPFSCAVLRARVDALLRRSQDRLPTVLSVGDLSLDPARHEVRRGEVDIALTPRQFSLLEFMMHNHDRVLSKREIMEHVWDFAYDGDQNIVEVYVRQLRQRIDLPFDKRTLRTVRGAGYRLDAD